MVTGMIYVLCIYAFTMNKVQISYHLLCLLGKDSENTDDNTKYEEEEKWNQLTNAVILVDLTFYD